MKFAVYRTQSGWYICELLSINGPWLLGESRESSYFNFALIIHNRLIDNRYVKYIIHVNWKIQHYNSIKWWHNTNDILFTILHQAIFFTISIISRLLFEIKEFIKNEDPKRDRNEILEVWRLKFFLHRWYHPVRSRFSRFNFRLGLARLYR